VKRIEMGSLHLGGALILDREVECDADDDGKGWGASSYGGFACSEYVCSGNEAFSLDNLVVVPGHDLLHVS
jgi:hypothetical protein